MREFIEAMRKAGRVIDIDGPCSPDDMKAAQKAAGTDNLLFFHNIGGAKAVMNVTADRDALALALG
ncbi:MAG: UbiD family decarboxylase, partial [Methanoregula sp.]|nr:UbiD family decarboxylase [Methanoregula sp.]